MPFRRALPAPDSDPSLRAARCKDAKTSEVAPPAFLTTVFDYQFPGNVADRIGLLRFKIRLPIFYALLREWTCKAIQITDQERYSVRAVENFLRLIDEMAKENLANEDDYQSVDQKFRGKMPFVIDKKSRSTLTMALDEIGHYVDQKRRAANKAKNISLAANYTLIQEEMIFAGVASASFLGIAYDLALTDLQRQTYSILAVLALDNPKDQPHLTLNMAKYVLKATNSHEGLLASVMDELLDGNLALNPEDEESLLLKAALLSLCSIASEVIITKKGKVNFTPNFISAAEILSVIFFKLALQAFVPKKREQSERYEYLMAIAKAYKFPHLLFKGYTQRLVLQDKGGVALGRLDASSGVRALLSSEHRGDLARYQLATYGEEVASMPLSKQLIVALLHDAIKAKGFYLSLSDLGDVGGALEALAENVMRSQSSPGLFQKLFGRSGGVSSPAYVRWRAEFDAARHRDKPPLPALTY